MRFIFNDGGQSKSKRPKEKDTCALLAASIATGLNYDFVYDVFKAHGRKYGRGCRIDIFASAIRLLAKFAGVKCKRIVICSFPLSTFKKFIVNDGGVFILFTKEGKHYHLTTCINNVIHDSFYEPEGKVVISIWKII